MKLLLIIGTTRENRKTDRAAKALNKKLANYPDIETETLDLKNLDIPHLKERRYKTDNPEPDIEKMGQEIENSDCIILISPEYNHSYPGPLKNALDHFYPEYEEKPFAYLTTSAGGFGGIRQLSHLHDFTLAVNAYPGPNLPISNIGKVINEEGETKTEEYEERINNFIESIIDFTNKMRN